MTSSNKIFRISDEPAVRIHIPGFHVPDFAKERYDGDPLMAHLAIKYLRDIIDFDHCAYLFDKNHDLADLSLLEEVQAQDMQRRENDLLAFKSSHTAWKAGITAIGAIWQVEGIPIEAMAEGPEKAVATAAHWTTYHARKAEHIANHPEPKPTKFDPYLLGTEAARLAAREIENKRRKDDADKCLGRFKALAGTTITTDLSKIWDDPKIESLEKAKITFDYFLQCQHTDAEGTVARLTADMNALHPATTVHGGRVLYQKMSILNETLTKVGPRHTMSDSMLIATIRTKLQGDAFDNLKFFHKQADGNTRPIIRPGSLFGTPAPERPGTNHVSWVQLGTNLIELSETKSTAASTSLEPHAFVSQEESIAFYAGQQYARYPPPTSYQQQPRRNPPFVPAASTPAWLAQSRPFQNLVQPPAYHAPAGAAPTPYSQFLQAHQQKMSAAKVGGQPPRPLVPQTAGRGHPAVPSNYGVKRPFPGSQGGGRGYPRPYRAPLPVYGAGGDIRCYMAQDDAEGGNSDAMQQEQLADGGSGATADPCISESAAFAYSVQQELETQQHQQPLQAPFYTDEYGGVHYLN